MMATSSRQNQLLAALPEPDLKQLPVQPMWRAFPRGASDRAALRSAMLAA